MISLVQQLLFCGDSGKTTISFCEAFLQIGNALSDLYTGTAAAHHEMLYTILNSKKTSNINIAIQRRFNNVFSDVNKSIASKFLSFEGLFWLISTDINGMIKTTDVSHNNFNGYLTTIGKNLLNLFYEEGDDGFEMKTNISSLNCVLLIHRYLN